MIEKARVGLVGIDEDVVVGASLAAASRIAALGVLDQRGLPHLSGCAVHSKVDAVALGGDDGEIEQRHLVVSRDEERVESWEGELALRMGAVRADSGGVD